MCFSELVLNFTLQNGAKLERSNTPFGSIIINMPIIVNLDVMMAKRKISSNELAEKIEITPANLSILKTGKAKAVRFSTLERLCEVLDCQPGDLLEYKEDKK